MRCKLEFDINTWITRRTPGPLEIKNSCTPDILVNLLLAIKQNSVDVWGEWYAPPGSPFTPRYWQGEVEVSGKLVNVKAYGGHAWEITASLYLDGDKIVVHGYGNYGSPLLLIDLLHDILLLALGVDPRYARAIRFNIIDP